MHHYLRDNPDASDLDYYITAESVVGSITKCGILKLTEKIPRWVRIYESIDGDDPTIRFSVLYKPGAIEVQEIRLRRFLCAQLEKLLVRDSAFQNINGSMLKELLFKRLYPVDVGWRSVMIPLDTGGRQA